MRYPKHLTLDFKHKTNTHLTCAWILSYRNTLCLKAIAIPAVIGLNSLVTPRALKQTPSPFAASLIFSTAINVNFIRKEKLYTKLKYSRCPQYDMVSGGLAALFSAFLGFLICEKFGLELLDSGDFYILLMYIIFFIFALRPLLKLASFKTLAPSFYSLKPAIQFYIHSLGLLLRAISQKLPSFLPSNYTLKGFCFWVSRHQYISVVWAKTCFWIKFLKNYPRDSEK